MASIQDAQNEQMNEEKNNKKSQLVIRAHYQTEDNSAEMTFSLNYPAEVPKLHNTLLGYVKNIYSYLATSVSVLDFAPTLELVEITAHEIISDDEGVIVEYNLGTFADYK